MASFANDSFDVDSFDPNSFFFAAFLALTGGYVEGTLVDGNGVVQIKYVDKNYSPISSDVYILGTLHRNDGTMYCTTSGALHATDVKINGIRHTDEGVRHVHSPSPVTENNQVSKGFLVSNQELQNVKTTVSGTIEHGILRNAAEEMIVAENP